VGIKNVQPRIGLRTNIFKALFEAIEREQEKRGNL
jgi:hypothetical protein